ncbi:MAG TPA: hypothetical protein PKX13_13990, partial [Acidiphilium sp.]|nr:hypothetical protein [Acidiphilium sp.]
MRKTVNQRDKKLTAMWGRISCFVLVARAIINLIDAGRQSGRCFGGLAGGGSACGFFSFDGGAAPVAFDVHFEDGGVVNE